MPDQITVSVDTVTPGIEVDVMLAPYWADVAGKPSEFPPTAHTHTIEQVTGLQDALDNKAAAAHGSTHRTGQADAIAPVVAAVTLTGSATILNVGPCDILRLSSSSAVDVRTMGADGEPWLRNGEERLIVNANASGGASITLKHEFTLAGSPANRFRSATGADVVLPAGGAVAVVYSTEASRWLVLSDARTPTAHTHGNITDAGAIGSTSGLPIVTGSGGVLQAGAFGTTAGTVCQGNDSRLSDTRTPTAGSVTDAAIAPAGLSASSLNWAAIQPWAANTAYAKGDLVSHQGIAYRRSVAGTSGATFSAANWQQITPSTFDGSQIASGTIATARLGSGTASNTTFLRGDQSYATVCDTFIFTRSSAPASASGSNGSYTWSVPATAKFITLDCTGSGGGGGSGRRGAAGTARGGGGGGGSGGRTIYEFPTSELPSLGLSVTVGVAGAGGAAVTANDTNGNAGAWGNSSSVAITNTGDFLAVAYAGTGGGGGTTAGGAAGIPVWSSTYGGRSGGAGGVGAGGNADWSVQAASAGGGGGGISTTDVASAGGTAMSREIARNGGITLAGGAAGGGNGTAGVTAGAGGSGSGGSGGGASITTAAGAGGNGSAYGGGGGGGGASLNGFNSGAGGNGGDGVVRITVWY